MDSTKLPETVNLFPNWGTETMQLYLSTPPISEHKSTLSTSGNMSNLRSARQTVVDLLHKQKKRLLKNRELRGVLGKCCYDAFTHELQHSQLCNVLVQHRNIRNFNNGQKSNGTKIDGNDRMTGTNILHFPRFLRRTSNPGLCGTKFYNLLGHECLIVERQVNSLALWLVRWT